MGLASKRPRAECDLKNQLHSRKKSQYHICLGEKQKLYFHYGLIKHLLLNYVHITGKAKGTISRVLLQLLEMRLWTMLSSFICEFSHVLKFSVHNCCNLYMININASIGVH